MGKRIFAAIMLSFLTFGSFAQKVYKSGSMIVFEAAGMPPGSYTKTIKPRTTSGSDAVMGSNDAANIGSALNNERVAYRFEIQPNSYYSASNTWFNAVNYCANMSGGNWRLPTEREHQMIMIFYKNIIALGGQSFDSNFWCATEKSNAFASVAYFTIRTVHALNHSKTSTSVRHVRCVRDMP